MIYDDKTPKVRLNSEQLVTTASFLWLAAFLVHFCNLWVYVAYTTYVMDVVGCVVHC